MWNNNTKWFMKEIGFKIIKDKGDFDWTWKRESFGVRTKSLRKTYNNNKWKYIA